MVSEGDRVELVNTTDEYTSLEPGDRGTVTRVDVDKPPIVSRPTRKYWVDWDDGGVLAMVDGEDQIKVVSDQSTEMACPECGETKFSWVLREVQFGTVHRFPDGNFSEEGMKRGEVVGSDVEENGVFCTTCEEFRDRNELVPVEE